MDKEAAQADTHERDHAIPVQVLTKRILETQNLDRANLETILHEWLVVVEVTASEHRELLNCGLGRCMPKDWDGIDPLARYRVAGIRCIVIER